MGSSELSEVSQDDKVPVPAMERLGLKILIGSLKMFRNQLKELSPSMIERIGLPVAPAHVGDWIEHVQRVYDTSKDEVPFVTAPIVAPELPGAAS